MAGLSAGMVQVQLGEWVLMFEAAARSAWFDYVTNRTNGGDTPPPVYGFMAEWQTRWFEGPVSEKT